MIAIPPLANILRPAAAFLIAVLVLASAHPTAALSPAPDLTVDGLSVKDSDGGAKLGVQFKIKNTGAADAKSILVWIDVTPAHRETRQIDRLAPGKSKSFELKVDHPTDPNPQADYVRVFADPSNTIAEYDEGNNQSYAYFQVTPASLPDLVVDQVNIKETKVGPPAELKVTVKVKNRGKTGAPPFNLREWQPENPQHFYTYPVPGGLGAGDSKEISFTDQPQHNEPVTILVQADPEGQIKESNEDNNLTSKQFKVKLDSDLPDFVVSFVHVSLSAGKVVVSFQVRNKGHDATGAIPIDVRNEKNLFMEDVTIPNGLKKGGVFDYTGTYAPNSLPNAYGTKVWVTVNPDAPQGHAPESDLTNNLTTSFVPDPTKKIQQPLGPAAPLSPAQ